MERVGDTSVNEDRGWGGQVPKMASVLQILPFGEERALLIHGKYVSEFSWSTGKLRVRYTATHPLTRAAAYSPTRRQLAMVDSVKTVILLSTTLDGQFGELCRASIDKAAMSAAFDLDGRLVVGDKFGDLIRFPLFVLREQETTDDSAKVDANSGTQGAKDGSNETQAHSNVSQSIPWKGEVIAGSVSMVTDLLIDDEYLIMADRDEKIRLINVAAPWIIEGYLLAHTQYVSHLLSCDPKTVYSLGADAQIMRWHIGRTALEKCPEPEPLQTVRVAETMEGFDPVAFAALHDRLFYCLAGQSKVFSIQDSLEIDSHRAFELPQKLRISAMRAIPSADRLILAGIDDHQTARLFLLSSDLARLDEINEFSSLVATLDADSLPWSLVCRTHLRKRPFDEHTDEDEHVDNDKEDEDVKDRTDQV